jgi:hypothetical protein
MLSYPKKFGSQHLHALRNTYEILKFAESGKIVAGFSKKITRARSAPD